MALNQIEQVRNKKRAEITCKQRIEVVKSTSVHTHVCTGFRVSILVSVTTRVYTSRVCSTCLVSLKDNEKVRNEVGGRGGRRADLSALDRREQRHNAGRAKGGESWTQELASISDQSLLFILCSPAPACVSFVEGISRETSFVLAPHVCRMRVRWFKRARISMFGPCWICYDNM